MLLVLDWSSRGTLNILFHILDGNKRRHQLRKKIVVEKKALEDAITKHNAAVEEADKLPPPNELLANDNYSWQWECKYLIESHRKPNC